MRGPPPCSNMKHIILETCGNRQGTCTNEMDPYTTFYQKLDSQHAYKYHAGDASYMIAASHAKGCISGCVMAGVGNLRARMIDIETGKALQTHFYSLKTRTPEKKVPLDDDGMVDVDALLEKIVADFS